MSTYNHGTRITALRRYVSLLREEEQRLNRIHDSPTASEGDLAASEARQRAAADKISSAEKEIRRLAIASHQAVASRDHLKESESSARSLGQVKAGNT